MSDHNDNFFKGFLFGGVIGAVLGILFAPKTGQEIRREITDESEKLVTKLKSDLEKAKVTFEEGKQKILETLGKEETSETSTNEEEEETPAAGTRRKSSRK